jgi:hypothetical protein
VSTTGVHKIEKKEVCRQPIAEARARARDGGSRSRWGALAGQGEAGSGHGRRPLPCQFVPGDMSYAQAICWQQAGRLKSIKIRT